MPQRRSCEKIEITGQQCDSKEFCGYQSRSRAERLGVLRI